MKNKINTISDSDKLLLNIEKQFNLEPFFESSTDFLCIAGYDGFFRRVNPAFIKLMGYTREELFASPISHFVHPQDKQSTAETRALILKGTPLLHFQNRYITKNGEIVWLTWTSIPEPSLNLIYAIAKNITHIKKLEEERNSLLATLTKVNAEFKQLTYTTSHDLRSPVNNLLSILSLLDISKIQDEETLLYIEMIETSAFQLKNTLNKHIDILNEEDKLNVKCEKVNLKDTLDNTLEPLRTLIEDSKAVFNIDFSEVPDINFNTFYLHSIFLNLISNSIKYSRPGITPEITISSKKDDTSTRIIFSDNGLGFDMEKVEGKIFGLHQSFHDHQDSKGIGLYLVNNYMNSLGGSIRLESKVNVGTSFILKFRS
ncbi:MAG: PAS domain-containing sensor histidine kinase [Salegentibacter sp.]|uniref:sensor histidine kinase n=1 Tax=Salegentibacter sp. TaxID=1903072 RepID=UPI002870954F|nr:PAS domain-containing sensor histidine kinase [Salegentibacter sp.]MDR9458241.1 PAS domain-containing sensor histidine kinase [Salegentibacter sp.]